MRYLSCILFLMFLASPVTFAQEGLIFFYDFNAEKEGMPPSAPWKPTTAGKVEVVNVPSATNKSVKITDIGEGGGMSLILDTPIKGRTVSLEFKWMREESSGGDVEIFYVMNQRCPDDWSGICTKMTTAPGGKFQYHNVNWIDAEVIVDKVWHDFKYVMHTDQNKYDLYYDGKEIVKGAAFRKFEGLEGEGIDKFNVANVGDGGSTFVMYFDDIILYEGTTRPLITSVKPLLKLTATWGEIKN